MKNIESKIQQACVNYFRYQYPEYAGCFFAVPNGGNRNLITAMTMKKEGVLAGVSDLLLLVAKNGYNGLCIEMKTENGKQQESQKIFQANVEKQGYKYVICRSLDDFMQEIKKYLSV